MNPNFLSFEAPILELDAKIEALESAASQAGADVTDALAELQKQRKNEITSIFSKLTPSQISQVSRHPLRPYTFDYIKYLASDFQELHGDRAYADDKSIIGGLARIDGRPVMIIGHQQGRDTKEKISRNFGMPRPEGYRKALRLMKLAERFNVPIVTFVDTPGAYPGIGAEERGQSEAIARNLLEMSKLKVPTICTIIGQGGSGGALAIAVGDRVMMLQYSTYSVISPEGCASILWKSAEKSMEAANAMGITADRLSELELIDHIIPEPEGGAHRDHEAVALSVKTQIIQYLDELKDLPEDQRLEQRYDRIMKFGRFKG
ncbi:acetyl-CoA carboxylase carboxyl transferase subunit alpha [Wohlfahrtiimonas larvae]|uniref:Acetyl-coenzyme A carboxylase carboxyl transferase subunit alpha n=1 Tax=Wohlfahrtiimonas larvae TaxID=1157986 RepID=A0ABP9MUU0_9GAMM|nr:acetyl-CoA carboxylase carboxyl transferase subunit alpha [Wohlfahrtiimonas larvae]